MQLPWRGLTLHTLDLAVVLLLQTLLLTAFAGHIVIQRTFVFEFTLSDAVPFNAITGDGKVEVVKAGGEVSDKKQRPGQRPIESLISATLVFYFCKLHP